MDEIRVQLPDGSVRQVSKGTTVLEVAKSISPRLAKAAACGRINGQLVDLGYACESDVELEIVTADTENGLAVLRHTAAHVMAHAVLRLWPQAQLAIGPTITNGFYYDFDVDHAFVPEDLERIEKEMDSIIKEDLAIVREEITREEALQLFREKGQPYKIELVEELGDSVSIYRQGDFVDLCLGPHLLSTGLLKAYKLLNAAGAYWRGDNSRPMLQRIYGTAFVKKGELDAYLVQLEEARKRDHNKLGRELELFMTSDVVGQGLPLLMPKGAKVLQILQRFIEDEEERRGYMHTKTPFMAKKELYEISGHWQHYRDGMFIIGDEDKGDEVLALRPMTCPFQFQIYKNRLRSYRDLPLRYAETSPLFRNESSGEMHGLIRVRQFTISEGHLICTLDQLEEEFRGVIQLIEYVMETLGLTDDIWFRFSKWDPNKKDKYIDNPEAWELTQRQMKRILENLEMEYDEADDEAAFYGPKLDIQARNVHGKEDTIITVQIDFALPERFDMTYVAKDGSSQRPVVIHRTSIGCYERTLAMLIEKYAGAFPVWLAPVQVRVLPIAERHHVYAEEVRERLLSQGVRVEVDLRNEKIGYKIREAQLQKIPYMLVLGDQEMEGHTAAVRSRQMGDQGAMPLQDFETQIAEEIRTKAR